MHGWLHATVAVATHYSNILNSTLCARYKWSTRGSGMHRIPAANIACIAHRMHGTAGTAGSARAWRCLRCCTLRGYAGRGALRTRASAAARGRRPRGRGPWAAGRRRRGPAPREKPMANIGHVVRRPCPSRCRHAAWQRRSPCAPTLLPSAPGSAIKVSFSALVACM
jgi:hypothetical protein